MAAEDPSRVRIRNTAVECSDPRSLGGIIGATDDSRKVSLKMKPLVRMRPLVEQDVSAAVVLN